MQPYTAPTPSTITSTRDTACEMAQHMRDGYDTEEALLGLGYSKIQIGYHGPEAKIIAARQSDRRIRR